MEMVLYSVASQQVDKLSEVLVLTPSRESTRFDDGHD